MLAAETLKSRVNLARPFGVMLHRNDKWSLKLDEEQGRWSMIAKYKPTVIARYPHQRILPDDPYYSPEGEKLFAQRLAQYRQSGT